VLRVAFMLCMSCFAERKDRTELEAKDKFFERWALEACLLFLCLVSTLCLFFATLPSTDVVQLCEWFIFSYCS